MNPPQVATRFFQLPRLNRRLPSTSGVFPRLALNFIDVVIFAYLSQVTVSQVPLYNSCISSARISPHFSMCFPASAPTIRLQERQLIPMTRLGWCTVKEKARASTGLSEFPPASRQPCDGSSVADGNSEGESTWLKDQSNAVVHANGPGQAEEAWNAASGVKFLALPTARRLVLCSF